jgi:hypothetical protein
MGLSLNQIESRSSVNHHPFSREIIAGFRLDAPARPFGPDIRAPGRRPLVAPGVVDRPRGDRCRGTVVRLLGSLHDLRHRTSAEGCHHWLGPPLA